MAVPTTPAELIELVRKSEILDAARLDAGMQRIHARIAPETARQLAAAMVKIGLLTQFQAEQFLLGKYRGFTIGKYKVLERLGAGGNSNVYLCEHLMVQRRVAVKVLPSARADNPAALARFYREARAAGVLNHPNLVKCHDIDQDNGLHFLVIDYVDGTNLQDLVTRFGPLTIVRAVHYLRQAAAGLQYAHQSGLIHRDIKPANILLERTGLVRILDLGLARFFQDEADQLTLNFDEKNVLGTADYVSPEQALNSHDVDIRADIYSLGATFYFLLAGHPPFPEGKAAQKLIWHQTRDPRPLHEERAEVPEALSRLVARMMAKDPAKRPQTPGEVIAALEPWAVDELPPPSNAEMPRLSRAARAANESGSSSFNLPRPANLPGTRPMTTRSMPAMPVGSSPRMATSTPRHASMADLATPSILASPTLPATSRPASNTAPAQAIVAAPVHPSAMLTEQRNEKASSAERPAHRSRSRALRIVALLICGALVGVVARWGVLYWKNPAPSIWKVSRSGNNDALPTISQALEKARPGDRIRVLDPDWEEAVSLDGSEGRGRDVTIEGAAPGGKPVAWRVPHGHATDTPLVSLTAVSGLCMTGFSLDGVDKLKELIALSGPCPGVCFENLTLTGFRDQAIALRDCACEQPLTLQRLRAMPTREAHAALLFETHEGQTNRGIRVIDCRLEGPYQAAVVFQGAAEQIELTHNRIYNSIDGLLARKAASPVSFDVALNGNTFYAIEKVGIHLEAVPLAASSRLLFTRNLFAHTGTLARIDNFSPQPSQVDAQWIWFDDARPGRVGANDPRFFRRTFRVEGQAVTRGILNLACDASFTVYVNGSRVGHGELQPQLRRVYAFDVTRYLQPGENVLAVQGTRKNSDAGLLAQLTYATAGAAPVTLVSDASWRVSLQANTRWTMPGFDDEKWERAKVVGPYGKAPWQELVWDAVVQDSFQGQASRLFPEPSGNVRDLSSQEKFPLLQALPLHFDLPTDTTDDARFLRYGRDSILLESGTPGVPPVDSSSQAKS
jgi:serine/threonine protein kinase